MYPARRPIAVSQSPLAGPLTLLGRIRRAANHSARPTVDASPTCPASPPPDAALPTLSEAPILVPCLSAELFSCRPLWPRVRFPYLHEEMTCRGRPQPPGLAAKEGRISGLAGGHGMGSRRRVLRLRDSRVNGHVQQAKMAKQRRWGWGGGRVSSAALH